MISLPYKGCVKANTLIPDLPQYNEDVVLLVILDNKHGERVPIQIRMLVIDQVVSVITTEEL